jgi:tetratricopeptide (TPR) repeat protein
MSFRRASQRAFLTLCLSLGLAFSALAQQTGALGQVDFPTSGSKAAQAHFLRGVAALHSFWYEEALEAFQAATKAEPDFVMGYWGEAMAHNHPLWNEQDTEAARKSLAKIHNTGKLTARESAYLDAIRALYGEGDRHARNLAYMSAMEKVYRAHPADLEAASFYALSLLGAVRPVDKGYRLQMQAGSIALGVYEKNPNHPGAAHYIIHAFDDPEHAVLALPAARRYAEIAPDAHHARHMPSHIFIQLGMWPEAAASNESSWATSDAWVKRKKYSVVRRDYHSLSWLEYVYLQQGRVKEAEAQLALMQQSMADLGAPIRGYPYMAAAFIAETERWDLIDKHFGEPNAKTASLTTQKEAGADACHVAAAKNTTTANVMPASIAAPQQPPLFRLLYGSYVRGMAAASSKNPADAEKYVARLRELRKDFEKSSGYINAQMVEIMELEVAALARANAGKFDEAVELLQRADECGRIAAPAFRPARHHQAFARIVWRHSAARRSPEGSGGAVPDGALRQPNRPRSLLGLARAAQTTDANSPRSLRDYYIRRSAPTRALPNSPKLATTEGGACALADPELVGSFRFNRHHESA